MSNYRYSTGGKTVGKTSEVRERNNQWANKTVGESARGRTGQGAKEPEGEQARGRTGKGAKKPDTPKSTDSFLQAQALLRCKQ